MSGENWDWYSDEMRQSVVIPQVDAVAVYTNPNGDLVIRQRQPLGEDDHVIIVPMSYAQSLILAIQNVASDA
ncbi:hypothetical protein LMG3482_01891 [Achromobacter deleyi]|uniref:hypothetical protein n=1 Tax=Achromobacter deleyi TaxID=1353891 RepID=UPI0014657A16|nr:hypothetical protein [Achromobacter deleyi]CAB3846373.1 hypothetical protein LMG3481_01528 [Achromobacter deleyi]CAB3853455.1 hypothetical protein LMG3482_01891 [Achromobacter deleyi]